MKVKYVGRFDPVEVEDELGVVHQAQPRDTIDVSDEFAARLLEQAANWQPVTKKESK